MKIYVIVKTARKDVKDFPGYFPNPHEPTLCLVDSWSGNACTPDKEKAEETANLLTNVYGKYFDYTVYELEIENSKGR